MTRSRRSSPGSTRTTRRVRRQRADLRADLEALDASYVEGLRGCEREIVVVSHDAFGYLAKYGLPLRGDRGPLPRRRADARRPRAAARADWDEGITTVFGERLAPPALVETRRSDAGVSTAVLDPIEGLSDENEGEDYLSLMRANLDALRAANGCP